MKTLFIILGNHLFDFKYHKNTDYDFFMCEDISLCTHFKFHKHKIMHFLISMREYRDLIRTKDKNLYYYEIQENEQYINVLKQTISKNKYKKILFFEIEDKFFEEIIINFCKDQNLNYEIIKNPMFMVTRKDFIDYLKNSNKPFLKSFYEKQRNKFQILMKDKKPIGGKYSYDSENRKKIPKKFDVITNNYSAISSPHLSNVSKLVNDLFPDHPGKTENFWIPVNRKQAIENFKQFLKFKIQLFGDFQDAIDQRDDFLYHSIISPSINIGHLTPDEVIREVEKVLTKENLNSVEGFIRQVLGWREFVRGIYQNFDHLQQERNFFNHQRKLKPCWYDGTTGIPPIDDAIKKAIKWGYCHHIERLMLLSNTMLLLEVHPQEVYRYFMEMFVDSSDWVMGPNVFGMGQFSDGGIFATKPYISGSNYILKMSHYKKDESWTNAIDGLYWQFIENKQEFLKGNHRLGMMVSTITKMDPKKKNIIYQAADELKARVTNL